MEQAVKPKWSGLSPVSRKIRKQPFQWLLFNTGAFLEITDLRAYFALYVTFILWISVASLNLVFFVLTGRRSDTHREVYPSP